MALFLKTLLISHTSSIIIVPLLLLIEGIHPLGFNWASNRCGAQNVSAGGDDSSHDPESSLKLDPQIDKYLFAGSCINYAKWFSIGCPQKGGIRAPIGRGRLVFVSPTSRKDVYIEVNPYNLDQTVQDLVIEGFNPTQPSLVYVPAWKESSESSWLRRIRRRYTRIFRPGRREPTFNLIIYEYPKDTDDAYRRVVKKVPALGKGVADLMNALTESLGYSMDQVHMIGFSLSAHIVGVAGRHLRAMGNPIGKITALDPSGPCFFGDSEFSKENTISADAAKLVVARHYGYGILGAQRSIGGVDIFVNGGKEQPLQIRRPHRYFVMWNSQGNHRASAFHEARGVTNGSCFDVAYKCDSYESFLDGACANCDRPSDCYHIGTLIRGANRSPRVDYEPNTRMYLKAGGQNFCLHHYRLVVVLSSNATLSTMTAYEAGKVEVDLGDDQNKARPKRPSRCRGAPAYTTLVTSQRQLRLRDVELYDKTAKKYLGRDEVQLVKLNYMSHPSKEARDERSITFCPSGPEILSTDSCRLADKNERCL